MKREIVAPAPNLELQLAVGAKKPKLGSGESSSPATGKHTDPHGHITDTRELKAAAYYSAEHGDTASEQQLKLHVDPTLVAPGGQFQAERGGGEMSAPAPPLEVAIRDVSPVLPSADRVAHPMLASSSTAPAASPATAARQVPCSASAAVAHHVPVSGQEPVLKVQLQKVFTARLAAHDILLYPERDGGLLGVGSSAVVCKGTAVSAVNRTDPAIPQRSASEAATTADNRSAKGSQDSRTFAVKLFKPEVGTPGTPEHREWNTPYGQAVHRHHIQRELKILQLLRGTKGVVQLCAIGEVSANTAVPGIIVSSKAACTADSDGKGDSSASPQLLQCAVLKKNAPLNQVLARVYPIREVDIKKMVSTLVEALDFLHSGRLCSNGQHYVVVHRDIKLDNLLLSPEGIILSDFGTAALVPVSGSGSSSSSRSSDSETTVSLKAAVGTPGFMAPEVSALAPVKGSDYAKPNSAANHTSSCSNGGPTVFLDTAVGSPLYTSPEMVSLFEFYKLHKAAAAAGDSHALQCLESSARPYTSSVDMWSLGVVVILMLGGGTSRMQQHLKVPDGMKQSDHMQDLVKRFVNGQVTLGVMSARNEQHNAAVREFVDCCCGINRQRMTAAQMMDVATRPIWLPKLS